VSLADRIREISEVLDRTPHGLAFDELFSPQDTRRELVLTFLAILEMLRFRMIRAYQATAYGTIRIVHAVADNPSELPQDSSNR
jgi:segregation and condensation protein A